jgi:hypothetical protein
MFQLQVQKLDTRAFTVKIITVTVVMTSAAYRRILRANLEPKTGYTETFFSGSHIVQANSGRKDTRQICRKTLLPHPRSLIFGISHLIRHYTICAIGTASLNSKSCTRQRATTASNFQTKSHMSLYIYLVTTFTHTHTHTLSLSLSLSLSFSIRHDVSEIMTTKNQKCL